MEMNFKHRIASGALALSLLGGTGAATVAQQPTDTAGSVAFAQIEDVNIGQLTSGLVNVNVNDVEVAVDVGDITVEDVVNVDDSLNDLELRILNNVLNNSPILSNNSEILTNVLQEADIIEDNQVVVGVLGGTFFVQDT